MAGKKNIIYVTWQDWESGMQFMTSQDTQVRVARAAIPLIFVPGIMGTRLKQKGGSRVWDPDDLKFMLGTFYNTSGAKRKELLINHPLEVNENDAGGTPTLSFRELMQMKFTYNSEFSSTPMPPNWDWLGLPPEMSAEDRLTKTIDKLIEHGWDQIPWGFYGDLLLKLSEGHMSELSRCFIHPVYAVGYNWIDDNKNAGGMLATRIQQIIDQENYPNHPCDRVILISHSMGGLVTRSCVIEDARASTNVIGIIHGAQPATGAPAAYRRMRAGFENTSWNPMNAIATRVMGIDDSAVGPILANCVGGLELLPTTNYKTNDNPKIHAKGTPQWLSMSGADGKVVESLPHSDPYTDIYNSEISPQHKLNFNEQFMQLVIHSGILAPMPGGSGGKAVNRYPSENPQALNQLHTNLKAASEFHKGIHLTVHDNTYIAYTGYNGLATFDRVHFSYRREQNAINYVVDDIGIVHSYPAPPETTGKGTDLDQHSPGRNDPAYFKIDNQDGSGDGTVPTSSGRALIDANPSVTKNNLTVRDDNGRLVSAEIVNVEHGAFFGSSNVQQFTMMAIRQLDWKYRFLKIGR
jgi:hypothetical protein